MSLKKEEIRTRAHTEGRPCEDARRGPPTSQGETPLKKPVQLTPLSHTSNLQNCENINLFFKHPHTPVVVLVTAALANS